MRQSNRFRVFLLMMVALTTCSLRGEAGVIIAPARLEAVVGPEGSTPGLRILNTGSESVMVSLSLVDGGHDLEGVPVFDESPAGRERWAGSVFLERTEVFLGPQESVPIKIRAIPEQGRGLYPVVMAEIQPTGTRPAGVVTMARVAVPVLLTSTPGNTVVRASELEIRQERVGGPVLLEGIVRNEGEVHVRAGARVAIEGPDTVDELLLKPVTVLPGAARRVRGEWRPDSLPPGQYNACLIPHYPYEVSETAWTTASVSFSVLRPYEVASAKPCLEQFSVRRTSGPNLAMKALVGNRGNIAGQARLVVEVTDEAGQEVGHRDWQLGIVAPGVGRAVGGEIPLTMSRPGGCLVTALLWHNGRQVAEETLSLRLDPAALAAR
ncbi:MAG: hypothetical protein ACOX4G_11645 [Limnochordia bacterium]|jgi:hypothetical protein